MADKTMDQIADKIQKLLALTGNNPSAQEAQAALLKAQALMAKYNIEAPADGSGKAVKYEIVTTKVKPHKFNNTLGVTIANSFACKIIISGGHLVIFGHAENAKAAGAALEFAFNVMRKGGDKATRDAGYIPGHEGAAHYYNSYVIGFINGLKQALDAQTVALAVVVPEDVNNQFKRSFPMSVRAEAQERKLLTAKRPMKPGLPMAKAS